MSRPKDDDMAVYDPYVQAFRKTQVAAIRKLIATALEVVPMDRLAESMTEDEVEALDNVVKAVNR